MRVRVAETKIKEAEVDPDIFISHWRSEWEDFCRVSEIELGDATDEDKKEFISESIGVMGMLDFFLPRESPWVLGLDEDAELEVQVTI